MADQQAEHGSQRVDAIIAAYIEAVEAGQVPDRQELLARHPDLAAELAAFFVDHDKVQQVAEPLRADAEEPQTLPPSETVGAPAAPLAACAGGPRSRIPSPHAARSGRAHSDAQNQKVVALAEMSAGELE
jgi:hypothetical protein